MLEIIGGGGMGLVYKAEDLKLGRRVALKFLPEELAGDPIALQRFEREARTASSLNHPNICTIYEVEEHEGQPFIVMELLEGETLRDRLASVAESGQKIPLDELLRIAIQGADGLEVAHEQGIIHRDVKPANIFLTRKGTAKILDFGLAKLAVEAPGPGAVEAPDFSPATSDERETGLQPRLGLKPDIEEEPIRRAEARRLHPPATPAIEPTLTRTGMAMGTAGYMSPEQVRGEKLDARTDLFSFGLVLYEMATGQRAFTGNTAAILKDAILNHTPAPVRELNSTFPPRLEQFIHKALAKDREKRYQSAVEMRGDLESVKRPGQRSSIGHRWKLLVPVPIVLAAIVAGTFYWRSHRIIQLSETDTLVVADFANSTGDPVFEGTLKQALAMQLEQSPFLKVLSEQQISTTLKLMNRPAGEHLTYSTALELCLRTNGRAVLEGSISSRGGHYPLEVRVRDCHTGDILASTNSEGENRNRVLSALGDIGTQLRKKLGEPLASMEKFNQPLEQATTSSLEALQAYTQGRAQHSQKGDAAAVPYYKLAVELDPDFAYAYAALGQSDFTLYEVSLALDNFKRAFALRDKVSQRERFYIDGVYYSLAGDLEKTIQTYKDWSQAYPRDYQPHEDLSRRLRSAGRYEEAAAEARQALARTRDTVSVFSTLMLADLRLNRLDEAKAVFNEAQARKLDGPYLRTARYQVAFREGDKAGMREQLAAGKDKLGLEDILLFNQAGTEAYYGCFAKSREVTEQAVKSARLAGAPERAAIYETLQGMQEVEVGNTGLGRRRIADALAMSKGEYVEAKAALVLARAGNPASAQELADRLNGELPMETMEQNYSLPTIRAAIEIARNNPSKAIDALKVSIPYELGGSSICCLMPVYMRGLANLQLGRGQEAAVEFRKILDHPGSVLNFLPGAPARLQLARAQVMSGDKAAARKSYQDFLTLWKDADPDIPIYQQAKAEYARLK